MGVMMDVALAVVPRRARRYLREWRRSAVFDEAMRRPARPEAQSAAGLSIAHSRQLFFGWANENKSASEELPQAIVRDGSEAKGPILERGPRLTATRMNQDARRDPRRKMLLIDHSSVLGGGQLGLFRYLRHDSQFERQLLVFDEGTLAESVRELGFTVTTLRAAQSPIDKLLLASRLRDAVERLRPDVVVVNSLTAMNVYGLLPARGAVSLAYLREDLSFDSIPRSPKRIMMERRTLRAYDGFLANSRFTAATIPDSVCGKPVRIAYPVSGVKPAKSLAEPPSGSPFTIVSLSRLAEWKGIHTLIDAAGLLAREFGSTRFRFLIAGDSAHANPSYAVALRERASRAGADVQFLGRVDDVESLIARVHALAICSTRPEPFGQVMVQAMAYGRAVISTAGGGPLEVLGATAAGFFVPPSDPQALAQTLIYLDLHREVVSEVARRGWSLSGSFADESTAPAFDAAIAELVHLVRQ